MATRRSAYRPTKNYSLKVPGLTLTGLSGGAFVAGLLLLVPLAIFLGIGLVMLMFGVVHSYYPPVPAFGWWETLGVYILVQMLTHKSSNNNS